MPDTALGTGEHSSKYDRKGPWPHGTSQGAELENETINGKTVKRINIEHVT